MVCSNYYNENNPHAAAWIRELMFEGQIPFGEIDERSITEVTASDVKRFTQCHFFAGIGGWSYALRLAGVPDDEPVWTGSCPCQPFSAAGKQKGEADERHLWPEFRRLIAECRPPTIFGEQVASRLGREWLAGVRADLEALGYAVGAADLCAASVGAPHIRQRLYWVGNAMRKPSQLDAGKLYAPQTREHSAWSLNGRRADGPEYAGSSVDAVSELANTDGRIASDRDIQRSGQHGQQPQDGGAGGVGYADEPGSQERPSEPGDNGTQRASAERTGGDASGVGDAERNAPEPRRPAIRSTEGDAEEGARTSTEFGRRSDFIRCLDGKSRRVEPCIFPLVDGLPRGVVPSGDPGSPKYANATAEARMMRLRGYGNAIVPQVAAEFIKAARGV